MSFIQQINITATIWPNLTKNSQEDLQDLGNHRLTPINDIGETIPFYGARITYTYLELHKVWELDEIIKKYGGGLSSGGYEIYWDHLAPIIDELREAAKKEKDQERGEHLREISEKLADLFRYRETISGEFMEMTYWNEYLEEGN